MSEDDEKEKKLFEQEFNLWLEMRRKSARVAHSLRAEDIRGECYPLMFVIYKTTTPDEEPSRRCVRTYDELLSMCELLLESLKECGVIQKYEVHHLKSPKSYKFD